METNIIIKVRLSTMGDEELTQEDVDRILLDTSQIENLVGYEKEVEIVE